MLNYAIMLLKIRNIKQHLIYEIRYQKCMFRVIYTLHDRVHAQAYGEYTG